MSTISQQEESLSRLRLDRRLAKLSADRLEKQKIAREYNEGTRSEADQLVDRKKNLLKRKRKTMGEYFAHGGKPEPKLGKSVNFTFDGTQPHDGDTFGIVPEQERQPAIPELGVPRSEGQKIAGPNFDFTNDEPSLPGLFPPKLAEQNTQIPRVQATPWKYDGNSNPNQVRLAYPPEMVGATFDAYEVKSPRPSDPEKAARWDKRLLKDRQAMAESTGLDLRDISNEDVWAQGAVTQRLITDYLNGQQDIQMETWGQDTYGRALAYNPELLDILNTPEHNVDFRSDGNSAIQWDAAKREIDAVDKKQQSAYIDNTGMQTVTGAGLNTAADVAGTVAKILQSIGKSGVGLAAGQTDLRGITQQDYQLYKRIEQGDTELLNTPEGKALTTTPDIEKVGRRGLRRQTGDTRPTVSKYELLQNAAGVDSKNEFLANVFEPAQDRVNRSETGRAMADATLAVQRTGANLKAAKKAFKEGDITGGLSRAYDALLETGGGIKEVTLDNPAAFAQTFATSMVHAKLLGFGGGLAGIKAATGVAGKSAQLSKMAAGHTAEYTFYYEDLVDEYKKMHDGLAPQGDDKKRLQVGAMGQVLTTSVTSSLSGAKQLVSKRYPKASKLPNAPANPNASLKKKIFDASVSATVKPVAKVTGASLVEGGEEYVQAVIGDVSLKRDINHVSAFAEAMQAAGPGAVTGTTNLIGTANAKRAATPKYGEGTIEALANIKNNPLNAVNALMKEESGGRSAAQENSYNEHLRIATKFAAKVIDKRLAKGQDVSQEEVDTLQLAKDEVKKIADKKVENEKLQIEHEKLLKKTNKAFKKANKGTTEERVENLTSHDFYGNTKKTKKQLNEFRSGIESLQRQHSIETNPEKKLDLADKIKSAEEIYEDYSGENIATEQEVYTGSDAVRASTNIDEHLDALLEDGSSVPASQRADHAQLYADSYEAEMEENPDRIFTDKQFNGYKRARRELNISRAREEKRITSNTDAAFERYIDSDKTDRDKKIVQTSLTRGIHALGKMSSENPGLANTDKFAKSLRTTASQLFVADPVHAGSVLGGLSDALDAPEFEGLENSYKESVAEYLEKGEITEENAIQALAQFDKAKESNDPVETTASEGELTDTETVDNDTPTSEEIQPAAEKHYEEIMAAAKSTESKAIVKEFLDKASADEDIAEAASKAADAIISDNEYGSEGSKADAADEVISNDNDALHSTLSNIIGVMEEKGTDSEIIEKIKTAQVAIERTHQAEKKFAKASGKSISTVRHEIFTKKSNVSFTANGSSFVKTSINSLISNAKKAIAINTPNGKKIAEESLGKYVDYVSLIEKKIKALEEATYTDENTTLGVLYKNKDVPYQFFRAMNKEKKWESENQFKNKVKIMLTTLEGELAVHQAKLIEINDYFITGIAPSSDLSFSLASTVESRKATIERAMDTGVSDRESLGQIIADLSNARNAGNQVDSANNISVEGDIKELNINHFSGKEDEGRISNAISNLGPEKVTTEQEETQKAIEAHQKLLKETEEKRRSLEKTIPNVGNLFPKGDFSWDILQETIKTLKTALTNNKESSLVDSLEAETGTEGTIANKLKKLESIKKPINGAFLREDKAEYQKTANEIKKIINDSRQGSKKVSWENTGEEGQAPKLLDLQLDLGARSKTRVAGSNPGVRKKIIEKAKSSSDVATLLKEAANSFSWSMHHLVAGHVLFRFGDINAPASLTTAISSYKDALAKVEKDPSGKNVKELYMAAGVVQDFVYSRNILSKKNTYNNVAKESRTNKKGGRKKSGKIAGDISFQKERLDQSSDKNTQGNKTKLLNFRKSILNRLTYANSKISEKESAELIGLITDENSELNSLINNENRTSEENDKLAGFLTKLVDAANSSVKGAAYGLHPNIGLAPGKEPVTKQNQSKPTDKNKSGFNMNSITDFSSLTAGIKSFIGDLKEAWNNGEIKDKNNKESFDSALKEALSGKLKGSFLKRKIGTAIADLNSSLKSPVKLSANSLEGELASNRNVASAVNESLTEQPKLDTSMEGKEKVAAYINSVGKLVAALGKYLPNKEYRAVEKSMFDIDSKYATDSLQKSDMDVLQGIVENLQKTENKQDAELLGNAKNNYSNPIRHYGGLTPSKTSRVSLAKDVTKLSNNASIGILTGPAKEYDASLADVVLPTKGIGEYKENTEKEEHRNLLDAAYLKIRKAVIKVRDAATDVDEKELTKINAFINRIDGFSKETHAFEGSKRPSLYNFNEAVAFIIAHGKKADEVINDLPTGELTGTTDASLENNTVVNVSNEAEKVAEKQTGEVANGVEIKEGNTPSQEEVDLPPFFTPDPDSSTEEVKEFPTETATVNSSNGPELLEGTADLTGDVKEESNKESDGDLGKNQKSMMEKATHVIGNVANLNTWIGDNKIVKAGTNTTAEKGNVLYVSLDNGYELTEEDKSTIREFLDRGGYVTGLSPITIFSEDTNNDVTIQERILVELLNSLPGSYWKVSEDNNDVATYGLKKVPVVNIPTGSRPKGTPLITISNDNNQHEVISYTFGSVAAKKFIKDMFSSVSDVLGEVYGYVGNTQAEVISMYAEDPKERTRFVKRVFMKIIIANNKDTLDKFINDLDPVTGLPQTAIGKEILAKAIATELVNDSYITSTQTDVSQKTNQSSEITAVSDAKNHGTNSENLTNDEKHREADNNTPADQKPEPGVSPETKKASLINLIESLLGNKDLSASKKAEYEKDLNTLKTTLVHKNNNKFKAKKVLLRNITNKLLTKYRKNYQGTVPRTNVLTGLDINSGQKNIIVSLAKAVYLDPAVREERDALLETLESSEVDSFIEKALVFQVQHGFATTHDMLVADRYDVKGNLKKGDTGLNLKNTASEVLDVVRSNGYGMLSRIPGLSHLFANGKFKEAGLDNESIPLDTAEKDLLVDLGKFTENLIKVYEDTMHPYNDIDGKKNEVYQDRVIQNPIMFLMDEDGNYPQVVLEAVSATLYSYVATRGLSTISGGTNSIASFLGIDTDKVTKEMYEKLDEGIHQNTMASDLGATIAKMTNVKMSSDDDPYIQEKYELALGKLAVVMGNKLGLLDFHSVPQSVVDALIKDSEDIYEDNLNPGAADFDEETGEMLVNFVKLKGSYDSDRAAATKASGEDLDFDDVPYNDLPEGFLKMRSLHKEGGQAIERLLGVEKTIEGPTHEPTPFTQNRLQSSNAAPSDVFKAGAQHAQQVAWEPVSNSLEPFMKMPKMDVLRIFGYDTDVENKQVMVRKGIEAKNAQLEREYQAVIDYVNDQENYENGKAKPMYFKYYLTKYGRLGMKSGTINPQNSKMHRHLFGIKSWNIEINKAPAANDVASQEVLENFKLAIAQGFGIKVDKLSIMKSMEDFHKSIMSGKGNLNTKVKAAVDSLVAHRQDPIQNPLDSAAIVAAVELGGEAGASYGSLVALAEYIDSGFDSFSTSIFFEVDGITNGLIATARQIVPTDTFFLQKHIELLGKGGQVYEGHPDTGNDEFLLSADSDDAYVTTTKIADAIQQALFQNSQDFLESYGETRLVGSLRNEVAGDDSRQRAISALELLTSPLMAINEDTQENGVTSEGRNWSKYPLMIKNYQGGDKSIREGMSGEMLTQVYETLWKVAQERDAIELQWVLDAMALLASPATNERYSSTDTAAYSFQDAEYYLSSDERLDELKNLELSNRQNNMIRQRAEVYFGIPLTEALSKLLITTEEGMSVMSQGASYAIAIAAAIFKVELRKAKVANRGIDLNQQQINTLLQDLLKQGKLFTIAHASSNDAETYTTDLDATEMVTQYPEDRDNSLATVSLRFEKGSITTNDVDGKPVKTMSTAGTIKIRVPSVTSSSAAVIQAIISTDANTNNKALTVEEVLNIYDAIAGSLTRARVSAVNQDIIFNDVHANWDMAKSFSDSLNRLYAYTDDVEYSEEIDAAMEVIREGNTKRLGEDAIGPYAIADALTHFAEENTIAKDNLEKTQTSSNQFFLEGTGAITNDESPTAVLEKYNAAIKEILSEDTEDGVHHSEEINWDTFEETDTTLLTHENVLDEFHKLEHESVDSKEHTEHLEGVINNLIAPVLKTLKGFTLNIGEGLDRAAGKIKGATIDLNLVKTQRLFASLMSPREVYVHENLHGVLGPALDADTKMTGFLQSIWEQAREHITPEDFLRTDSDGNPIFFGSETEERAIAQERYNHIFANGKNGLHELYSLGLSNEALIKILLKHKYITKVNKTPDTLFGAMMGAVKTLLVRTFDSSVLHSRLTKETTLYDALNLVAENLVRTQTKQKSRWLKSNKVMNAADKIASAAIADYILPTSKAGYKLAQKGANTGVPGVKQITSTVGAVIGIPYLVFDPSGQEAVRNFASSVYKVFSINKRGFIHQIVMEIKKTSAENKSWERLLRVSKHATDIARNRLRDSLNHQIDLMWDQGNIPSTNEWVQLNAGILKTDLSAVMDQYDKKEIVKLMDNDAFLFEEIKKLRGSLQGNKYHMNQAKGLGYYMATGVAGMQRQMLNAHSIADMTDVTGKRGGQGSATENTRKNIDRLATLYAIRYTNRSVRKTTAKFAKHEFARKVPTDGFSFMMEQHNLVKNTALTDTFAGNPYSMQKGYTYESFDPKISTTVVPGSKIKQLEAEGYTVHHKVKSAVGAPNVGNLYFMVNNNNLQRTYQSGVITLINRESKGTTIANTFGSMYSNVERAAKLTQETIFDMTLKTDKDVAKMFVKDIEIQSSKQFMIPIVSVNGKTQEYRHTMRETTKNEILGKKDPANKTLGKMLGSINDQKNAPIYNKKVIDDAFTEYQEMYEGNENDFIHIEDGSSDPSIQEIYNLLPKHMTDYAKEKFGTESFYLRAELFNMVIGYKNLSVVDGINKYLPKVTKPVLSRVLRNTELMWQDVVKINKRKTIVLTPGVAADNAISNVLLSVVSGMPAAYTAKEQFNANEDLRRYVVAEEKYDQLDRLIRGNPQKATTKLITDRDRALELMRKNPIKPLLDAGLFQTYTEDMNFNDDATETKLLGHITYKDFGKKVTAMMEDKSETKAGGAVATAYDWLTLPPSNALGKLMTQIVQRSDFVARAAMYKFLTEEQGVSHEAAIERVIETFINYEVNTSPAIQYSNQMGLTMYTKFWLRIQRVIYNQFKENTARAAAMTVIDQTIINTPVAHGSFMPGDIGFNKVNGFMEVIEGATKIPIAGFNPF